MLLNNGNQTKLNQIILLFKTLDSTFLKLFNPLITRKESEIKEMIKQMYDLYVTKDLIIINILVWRVYLLCNS